MWIFIRALSMNLQICFDIVPGRKFFYLSQALGWGIPAALFTATMTVTGVSFRMGNACHVNHETSMQDFWGPLLGLAGAAGIVQLVTFAYCVHVYLKNLWTDQAQSSTHGSSSGLPSYNGSVRTQTAHAVYRRLKKVLWLQWRGICIITIILVDVIFFSIVFVYLDGLQGSLTSDWHKVEPWLECLAFNPTNKDKCLGLVTGWLVNEPTVVAVLLLLSLTGIQVFIFLARPSIFPAWYDFVQDKLSSKRQEFVSLDARPNNMRSQSGSQLAKYDHVRGHQSTTFEMQKPQLNTLAIDLGSKSPTQTMLSSPSETYRSPIHHDLDIAELDSRRSISPPIGGFGRGRHAPSGDYFDPHRPQQQRRAYTREASTESLPGYSGRFSPSSPPQRRESHERRYQAPVASFSAPKTPSRQSSTKSVAFAAPMEAKEVYGRGGLALNPPSEAGESQEDLTGRGFGLDRR
ncbi:hypothetical protein LTR91_005577 [Friedmanniomyces endolithicus]|uniref:G-protein coupled receptors family 2 profile 2 domain-containing protein n=1 Tax=Friedmanniomyces endolithicus TaxID=329885 RepID=A0AAN6QXB9_9PEZI|nr:hypothetical protein LTS01_016199 [Friedmanniomyces endolithicus]KAK1000659.1 hypothetical protein LTR91_005577 [Friedmanniomyces endolithicus]